jgi:outer membrane protein assembly factor BamB
VSLSNLGVGGVAANEDCVIVSDRDAGDRSDVFRCLAAADGKERWVVRYLASGRLDYGSSPRATPLIAGERVYLYGAFGTLSCVDIAGGRVIWRRELQREFPPDETLSWGVASSPTIVDGRLIVMPGSTQATLLALDPADGKTLWQSPGAGPAFASLVLAKFGGVRQLIGYDRTSLGGWNPATGERLWTLIPQRTDDFNVPTPIVHGDRLIVATENNGTRLYGFDAAGRIVPRPEAEFEPLAPDTHTPVVAGKRLFGVWGRLFCLDLSRGLAQMYSAEDDAFAHYTSLIASDDRVLVTTQNGELMLFNAKTDDLRIVSRLKIFANDSGVYSHPALVGDRLYVRGSDEIVCLKLPTE